MEYQPVYDQLVQAARAKELVHYGELAKRLGIDMDDPYFGARVGKVLGRISEDEIAAGRPMISAIVVSKDTMLPGHGLLAPIAARRSGSLLVARCSAYTVRLAHGSACALV